MCLIGCQCLSLIVLIMCNVKDARRPSDYLKIKATALLVVCIIDLYVCEDYGRY